VAAQLLAVEIDGRERVEPAEHQPQPLVGLERLGAVEPQAVPPLAIFHPGAVQLVAVIERILDPSGIDQRPVDVTRDAELDPAVRARPPRIGRSGLQTLTGREVTYERGIDEWARRPDAGGTGRRRLGGRRHLYFTPPAVRPPTM